MDRSLGMENLTRKVMWSVVCLLVVMFGACNTAGGGASNPAQLPVPSTAGAWSFGVLSDTQWIGTDDGQNPNTSAVSIIKQINQQFIARGVKLVVAVGDLADTGNTVNEDVR